MENNPSKAAETGRSIPAAEAVIQTTVRVLNAIGMIALTLMMLATVGDVFLRYVFNKPILGIVELVECLMVAVVFLALPRCTLRGGNAKVEALSGYFPAGLLRVVDVFTNLLSLGILLVITWQAFREFTDMYEVNRASDMLGIPAYPFYFIVGFGSLILCGVLVFLIIQLIHKGKRDEP